MVIEEAPMYVAGQSSVEFLDTISQIVSVCVMYGGGPVGFL